jgi:hypothetical protein
VLPSPAPLGNGALPRLRLAAFVDAQVELLEEAAGLRGGPDRPGFGAVPSARRGRVRAAGGLVPTIATRTRHRPLVVALVALVLSLGPLGVAPPAAAADGPLILVDVPVGSYYEDAVGWMLHEGLTTGVGGRAEFQPARAVTRAEAVTFLWRLAGQPPAAPSGFSDVPDGRWYSTAVGWAKATGITTGIGGTNRFAPDAAVTRAEAVTFLWRMAGRPAAPPSGFSDVPSGRWYSTAVGWAKATGITTGVGGTNRFAPDQPVSRAELATFLWRAEGRPQVPPPVIPAFRFEVRPISAALAERMASSWRSGCPVPLSDLRYLTIRHWGFHGRPVDGEMVVHAHAVPAVRAVFERLYRDRFPIERMRLVDDYGGDDGRSMAANNTSAFNCRRVTGGAAWSEHAYGRAIDVNPVQNPYVAGGTVLPSAGRAYLDRTHPELGKIREGDAFVRAVDAVGWGWGGRWRTVKDYQHISSTGR